MRTQPRTQEGPKPLPRLAMDSTKPVSVIITRIFTSPMTNIFVFIAPLWQWIVDGILVGVNLSAECNSCLDERFNGYLFNIAKHPNHHFPTPLNHAKNRWLFLFERTS